MTDKYYSIDKFLVCIKKGIEFPTFMFDNFVRGLTDNFTYNTDLQHIFFNGEKVKIKNTNNTMKMTDFEFLLIQLGKKNKIHTVQQIQMFRDIIESDCFRDNIIPVKFLGSGMEGPVYQICTKNSHPNRRNFHLSDCDYVLKVVYDDGSGSIDEGLEFQKKFQESGLTIKIIDDFRCKTRGISLRSIIMEKLDGNLYSLEYPFSINTMKIIFPQVLNIMYTLLKYKICHNDTKMDNFLYKKNSGEIKVYIVDFGLAKEFKSDAQNFSHKFFQGLSLFRKTYKNPEDSYRWVSRVKDINMDLFDEQMKYFIENNMKYKNLKVT